MSQRALITLLGQEEHTQQGNILIDLQNFPQLPCFLSPSKTAKKINKSVFISNSKMLLEEVANRGLKELFPGEQDIFLAGSFFSAGIPDKTM